MNQTRCYIESHYKIDHSQVDPKMRTKFAVLGKLFDGQPICAWCITKLAVVADPYGYANNKGQVRGYAISADAKVSVDELIKKSPLKRVFFDYPLAEIKYNLDNHLYEIEPQTWVNESIETAIERIKKTKFVRQGVERR